VARASIRTAAAMIQQLYGSGKWVETSEVSKTSEVWECKL